MFKSILEFWEIEPFLLFVFFVNKMANFILLIYFYFHGFCNKMNFLEKKFRLEFLYETKRPLPMGG